uniref:DUF4283 domain-containing protein n=1 Tax=Salix viminalis TaxID=40686 RepID=A0A6N2N5A0_SALVM
MVGFFPGYKMPFHAARSIARRAWDSHGLEQVMTMDAGYLIFRFKSEAAMQEVLAKGPWMFGGKHIALQQWHPQVQFERNKMRKMPVWVRIYACRSPCGHRRPHTSGSQRDAQCKVFGHNCQKQGNVAARAKARRRAGRSPPNCPTTLSENQDTEESNYSGRTKKPSTRPPPKPSTSMAPSSSKTQPTYPTYTKLPKKIQTQVRSSQPIGKRAVKALTQGNRQAQNFWNGWYENKMDSSQ